MGIDQDDHSKYILPPTETNKLLQAHHYRMKAVDDIKNLGNMLYCISSISVLQY